jgi:hypothetical protein
VIQLKLLHDSVETLERKKNVDNSPEFGSTKTVITSSDFVQFKKYFF